MSKRNEPRQPEVKFTEFVEDAVGAVCSRCLRQVFQLGKSKKKFGDLVRDQHLWRIREGALTCLDCLLTDIRQYVLARPDALLAIKDETGRMLIADILPDAKLMLVEYAAEGVIPPSNVSPRRITIDATWLDHLLRRTR